MNQLTELRDALPRAIEDALVEAIESPLDAPDQPLRVSVEGIEYTIGHGDLFTVAGLARRDKSVIRRLLERHTDHGVIFMDEPFAKLESDVRTRMQQTLKSVHSDMQTTIVFLTDDCDEALALGDQVVITRGTAMPGTD